MVCCRLAGVALVVPAVNYWWPMPANVSSRAFEKLDARDRMTFWIAHHTPTGGASKGPAGALAPLG
jgi:hypothetical protein